MDVPAQTERPCLLALRAGREEPCAGEECPLWEHGACTLEKLAADGEPEEDWPDAPFLR
jgi:hypothetical protein